MKILFLTDNYPPETNAPAIRTAAHARAWVAEGHDVTVITCAPNFPKGEVFEGYSNDWLTRERTDGVDVLRVKTYIAPNKGRLARILDYTSFMVAAVAWGLTVERPDIIVGTSPQFFTVMGAALLATLRRRGFVFELRDLWPDSIGAVGAMRRGVVLRALEQVELALYRRSAAVVPVTNAFRDNLVARGIRPDKIHVVLNGVDEDVPTTGELPVAQSYFDGHFVAAYIGTIGLAHGIANILEAARLCEDDPRIRFLLVGSGAEEELVRERLEREGPSNVTLISMQPRAVADALLARSTVSLVHLRDLPIFRTVLPSKIFSAMKAGRPVLCVVPEGEASQLVAEHGVGQHVQPDDPRALAKAIRALADDPARLEKMAQASVQARDLYARPALARRMLEVLQTVAGER